jgi:hypothetical protein
MTGPPSANGTLNTTMDLGYNGGPYQVHELDSTIDGPFCYVYAATNSSLTSSSSSSSSATESSPGMTTPSTVPVSGSGSLDRWGPVTIALGILLFVSVGFY